MDHDVYQSPGGGCDRALFAQVWSRVAGPDCPVEAEGPEGPACPLPPPPEPPRPGERETGVRTLQRLLEECAAGAEDYRRLGNVSRRRRELYDLAGKKAGHMKRLSAACFLMTGVRYQPRSGQRERRPAEFFSLLRERYLEEGRLAARLRALAAREPDECLRALYGELGEETEAIVRAVRRLTELES